MALKIEGLDEGGEGFGDLSEPGGSAGGVFGERVQKAWIQGSKEADRLGKPGGSEASDKGGSGSDGLDRLGHGASAPRITKMVSGVRDQNRVNIFVDGKFAFSLDVAQVVEYGIKVRQEVGSERLATLKAASEFGLLYQRTLEWVLMRPRSVRETRDYLRRRQMKRKAENAQRARNAERVREGASRLATKLLPEIRDETIELVVARLVERGYLDDRKFARYFVENRNVKKGASERQLRMELQKKGVAEEIIWEALAEAPRDSGEEMRKIIAKKRAKYDDQKLVTYLVRQGFPYAEAKEEVEGYGEG